MKISIITATYNDAETIEDTIKSVMGQSYSNLEHIIVNDGSQDETTDIIRKYEGKYNFKLVSQENGGMYGAMNKGIESSSGDIIGILNSDDFYASNNVIETVVKEFEKTGADCIWGDLVYVDPNNLSRVVRDWKSSPYKEGLFQKGWHPPHPTLFVKKSVYEKYGVFRTDLSTAADYELMLRFLEKNKISSAYIPQLLVKMRAGGESNKSYYNLIRANWYCYKAFGLNGLKINPLFILKKPWFKRHQF
jgi:glycosyltransferase